MKTTLEKAKEDIHKNIVGSLQDLLERTYDSQEGYKKAMKLADSSHLVDFLKRRAAQRGQFANQLDLAIRNLNQTPVQSGSTKAAIHRGWMNVKAFMSNTTDETILNECIRGEKASLDTYTQTLANQNFPQEIIHILNTQMDAIRDSLKQVKQLEKVEEMANA